MGFSTGICTPTIKALFSIPLTVKPDISPTAIFEKFPHEVSSITTAKINIIFSLIIPVTSNIDCNFKKRKDANLLQWYHKLSKLT